MYTLFFFKESNIQSKPTITSNKALTSMHTQFHLFSPPQIITFQRATIDQRWPNHVNKKQISCFISTKFCQIMVVDAKTRCFLCKLLNDFFLNRGHSYTACKELIMSRQCSSAQWGQRLSINEGSLIHWQMHRHLFLTWP